MAVRLQFINLIIPVPTLDRVLAAEGGFERVIHPLAGDMLWYDQHLCRVDGAMNWGDVDGMAERWEAYGLQGLVGSPRSSGGRTSPSALPGAARPPPATG